MEAIPTPVPSATRTMGGMRSCSIEYLKKRMPARLKTAPPRTAAPRTPSHRSHSMAGPGEVGGGGLGGEGRGAIGGAAGIRGTDDFGSSPGPVGADEIAGCG